MQVTRVQQDFSTIEADALVLGVFADRSLAIPTTGVPQALRDQMERLFAAGEISGKLLEQITLWNAPGVAAPLLIVIGLGKRDEWNRGRMFQAAATAARSLSGKPRKQVAYFLDSGDSPEITESGVAGALVGCQGQDLYRNQKNRHPFGQLLWNSTQEQSVQTGTIVGEAINLARQWVNEPPQTMYPESFAEIATSAGKECGLAVEVWDEKKLAAERCGSLLAVNRGSDRPARLVILRHQPAPDKPITLALVGKGVTFDAGGLSIKTSDGMKTMKCDMAGGATVLAVMQAVARLKLPVNVIGLVGLVENMLGGSAMKLGDVLHARSGKTIEVLNTDAEGRLVLADVLNVALDHKPERMIDLATLTGACVVALGNDVAGLMTNDQGWCDEVSAAAATVGEQVWQLPMFPEYSEQIRSEVADIRNIGDGRWGGAISAAKFLEEFVDGKPWTHIDIAGPAFLDKPKPWQDAGGSGALVRTMIEVVRRSAPASR